MLRISRWGIKTFSQKKFEKLYGILKSSRDFLPKIKSEVKAIGPLMNILRISFWGIKHFLGKKGHPSGVILVAYTFLDPNEVKVPHTGYSTHLRGG